MVVNALQNCVAHRDNRLPKPFYSKVSLLEIAWCTGTFQKNSLLLLISGYSIEGYDKNTKRRNVP